MKNMVQEIEINQIDLWFSNPRYYDSPNFAKPLNEEQSIIKLFEVVGAKKMINLAENISINGLLYPPIVVKNEKKLNSYICYEGNRRIACIKCIINPEIIKNLKVNNINIYEYFIVLNKNYKEIIVSQKILSILKDKKVAEKLVVEIHSKSKPGIKIESWSTLARDKHNSENSLPTTVPFEITQQIKEKLKIDVTKKIDYTNIDRLFSGKKVKEYLNYDYKNLNKQESEMIISIIDKANEKVKGDPEGFSRVFNTQDKILNWIKKIINKKNEDEVKEKLKIEESAKKPIIEVEKKSKLKNKKGRNTLIDTEWANIQISKSRHDLQKIKSLIYHLAKLPFESEYEINNYSIIALAIRALIEHLTFLFHRQIYPEKDLKIIESDSKGLEGFVNHARSKMVEMGLLTNTQSKIANKNKNLIHSLQGSIHDAKTSIDLNTLKDIFDTHREYLEVCIKTIK